jgi:hypothetical protein
MLKVTGEWIHLAAIFTAVLPPHPDPKYIYYKTYTNVQYKCGGKVGNVTTFGQKSYKSNCPVIESTDAEKVPLSPLT